MRIPQFNRHVQWIVGVLAIFSLTGCPKPPASDPAQVSAKPRVVATNLPLKYFAVRIGESIVGVDFLVPEDDDPAYWVPEPDAILNMQSADLVLMNGADYEKWLNTVTLNDSRVIDTSSAFKQAFITMKGAVTHSHGPTGEHTHSGLAKTTWLDFQQARMQANAIVEAFSKRWPEHREAFEANGKLLDDDLIQLDRVMTATAAKIGQTPLVVSHPEYDYWARRYELNVAAVHWEADEDPDDDALAELTTLIANHPAKIMIWEDEPHEAAVAKLDAMGIKSVVFAPRGNASGDTDWLTMMRENVAELDNAFSH